MVTQVTDPTLLALLNEEQQNSTVPSSQGTSIGEQQKTTPVVSGAVKDPALLALLNEGTQTEQPVEQQKPFDPTLDERLRGVDISIAAEQDILKGRYERGELSTPSYGFQTLFGKAGLGGALAYGGAYLAEGFDYITPEFLKEGASDLWAAYLTTNEGKALTKVLKAADTMWTEFEEGSPELSGNIKAMGNILELLPVTGAAGKTRKAVGEAFEQSAETTIKKRKVNFIQEDLLTPADTSANRKERLKNTFEIKGKDTYVPTNDDLAMFKTVEVYTDVSPKRSLVGNYQEIDKGIGKIAEELDGKLGTLNNYQLDTNRFAKALTDKIQKLADENPTLTGDAGKAAMRVAEKAARLIAESDKTPLGLLNVRRDLDTWIMSQGKDPFSGLGGATDIAVKEVRKFINDAVDEVGKAKGIDVRDALAKQSILFSAKDVVAEKAIDKLQSTWSKVEAAMARAHIAIPKTLMGTIYTAGAVAGSSLALGVTATAVTGLLGAAVIKGAISPSLRKVLGWTLKNSGKLGGILPADRAALAELLKLPDDEDYKIQEEPKQKEQLMEEQPASASGMFTGQ